MNIKVLKSKGCNLPYTEINRRGENCVIIGLDLMDELNLMQGEIILIIDDYDGSLCETYVKPGKIGGQEIILSGPALTKIGSISDTLTIMSFAYMNIDSAKTFKPCLINRKKI